MSMFVRGTSPATLTIVAQDLDPDATFNGDLRAALAHVEGGHDLGI